MIQVALNGMITLMMAKFIINDLPHAAGLTAGTTSTPVRAPQPSFITHSTNRESYESILRDGWILPKPVGGYVPVSLDGGLNGIWGDYVFTFPLKELQGKKIEPVFYLGTSDVINTVQGPGFLVMDMVCIFATEITVYEALNASQAKVSKGVPPLTPLTRFLTPAVPELKKHGLAAIEGNDIGEYSLSTLAIIDAYNKMVAELFNIDYNVVKGVAEKEVQEGVWEPWWR